MNKIEELKKFFSNLKVENFIDIVIAISIIIFSFVISAIISYFIVRIIKGKETKKEEIKEEALFKPIKWYIRATGFYIAIIFLQLPDKLKEMNLEVYKIACIIIIAKGITNLVNPKSKIFKKLEEKTSYNGGKTLNNFVSKVVKAIVYICAAYIILLELGFNLGGLITGLGISSVVIALAAQDIAKNLFGGMAIIVDKPFVVGDWIESKDYSGTVIDITFRSTKIKAIDNTIITVQNSSISENVIKNWGKLKQRRYSATLNIPLETSKQTIEKLIKKIKFVLKTNKQIVEDSLQVHFEKIDRDSIQIYIYLNTFITDYTEYEFFKDEINLELINILKSENVKLEQNARKIYIENNNENNIKEKDV